ncbi:MAG: cysteine peptidase family C39 domain-containing protein [Chthoniobacteraceae bacterium]
MLSIFALLHALKYADFSGIIGIILACVLFTVTYSKLKTARLALRFQWLLLFAVLSIPTILYVAYYSHKLPETEAFYEFRSWRGTELLVAFTGGLAGVVTTFLHRTLLPIPLACLVVVALIPFAKPLFGPIPDSDFQDRWNGPVCLQSTASTCGPASLATIMTRLGIKVTELEIARAAYSYEGGTEAWYLARYARKRGLKAEFIIRKGFSPDISLPAIAGVGLGSVGHFIPILAREGDFYITGDPGHGESRLTREQLLKIYRFTGFYMPVSK